MEHLQNQEDPDKAPNAPKIPHRSDEDRVIELLRLRDRQADQSEPDLDPEEDTISG